MQLVIAELRLSPTPRLLFLIDLVCFDHLHDGVNPQQVGRHHPHSITTKAIGLWKGVACQFLPEIIKSLRYSRHGWDINVYWSEYS